MLKITFVFFHFLPNIEGTGIPLYNYAKELVKRGHHIEVFTSNAIMFKRAILKREEVVDGIIIRRFNVWPFPYRYFFLTPSIIPALAKTDTNLIFVSSLLPFSFFTLAACLMARIRHIPLIFYPFLYPSRFSKEPNLIRVIGTFHDRVIGRRVLKMANWVIALTEAEAEHYRKETVKNVSTIYEGVSLDGFHQEAQVLRFRQKHGLTGDGKIILTVGRVGRQKGTDFAIKAFSGVVKRFLEAKLVIVGADRGPFASARRDCTKLAQQLECEKNVVFIGEVSDEDLACAYELADVVIVPSTFEAYGRVVVEAWAHKKPVIATKSVALSELISPKTGALVDYGDTDALTEAITKILCDKKLARLMGFNGYLLIRDLTWEKRVDKIEEIFRCARLT